MTAAKELTEWDLHHVFEVECRGDTLIVTPRGDALGFPEAHFRDAVRRLRDRFDVADGCDGRQPRNLIIDATGRDYPGLEMLAAFRDLIETVRRRGGTAAVAGSSPETELVLHEFHVGDDWTVYPDLATAARSVVHEPVTRRVWRWRRGVFFAAALPVLALAIYAAFAPARDAAAFADLGRTWGSYRHVRINTGSDSDRRQSFDRLADYAAGRAIEFEGHGLRSAAEAAGRMAEIIRSPIQPAPGEAKFEHDLRGELTRRDIQTPWMQAARTPRSRAEALALEE